MAASVDSPSPSLLTKERNSKGSMTSPSLSPPPLGSSSSPLLISSDSDKRFWSSLRNRVDVVLENNPQQRLRSSGQDQLNLDPSLSVGRSERAKRMKEDSLLLLRGFDSVSQTLSHLSSNLGNALQGVRSLAEPPTLSEMLQSKTNNSEAVLEKDLEARESDSDGEQKGLKRKFELGEDDASGNGVADLAEGAEEISKNTKLKKAKNMAVSLAIKAASLAREMRSLRSDLSFTQERCDLLEEENRRLRDGFSKGIRPEEDDLMRLQMEFLLAEKSRLATENANLVRENQCLHQLVEYHQATSQDISASYEEVLQGICLDFGSPSLQQMEDEDNGEERDEQQTCKSGIPRLAASLDEDFDQEQGHA